MKQKEMRDELQQQRRWKNFFVDVIAFLENLKFKKNQNLRQPNKAKHKRYTDFLFTLTRTKTENIIKKS